MFDHHHGVALVAEPMQYFEELGDIVKMQASGWFVQDVEGLAGISLRQFARQLDALCFTARQRGGALTKSHVRQADIHQGRQFALEHRHGFEELVGFLDRHVEHLVDVLPLVPDF